MTSRTVRAGRNAVIGSLIVVAILILANYVLAQRFVRLDLTENKEYTISPSTREVLGDLDDLVNVTVYFSQKLPSYLSTLSGEVDDMLREFRAYSHGNLIIEFKDPATDTELENKVRRLGIPQVQLDVIEKDSRQLQNAYLGIAVGYEDRTQVIPIISSLETLEYELTAAILKVRQKEDQVIGYLTGHGEPDLFSELDSARQELEKQYVVRQVDLDSGRRSMPDDVNTLMIVGAAGINEREKYLIDQFLMRGGKLVILEDAMQLAGGSLSGRPIRSGLENLLPHYGIKVEEELVLDPVCATAGFNSGYVRFMVRYPYWPQETSATHGFNPDNPVVAKLEVLVTPWVSAMSESEQKPETAEYIPLVSSSDHAWLQGKPFNLNPQQQFAPNGEPQSYTVAAALSGTFTSYYAEREIPEAPADTSVAVTAAGGADEADKLDASQVESQIVVVGTSYLVRENFLAQFPANLTFVQNAIDWVTLGNELISIRSRSVSDRPLKPEILVDEAAGQRSLIKFIGTFATPILFGGFVFFRWMTRRREKRTFEESLHHVAEV